MLMNVFYAFLSIALLGALLGIGLAVASLKLSVKKDTRISSVEESLPGINCGACGYAGCAAYAEAIVDNAEELTLCSPGGKDTAEALARIMGQEIDFSAIKQVALVHCWGNEETRSSDFRYEGIEDCNAAFIYFSGADTCKYGCLALGSCIRVCPVSAITKREDGRIHVDRNICIACEKCVEVCPTKVMQMVPHDSDWYVACNSPDKGAMVRKYCSVGCIGCRICEKKFEDGGFKVDNNLASAQYDRQYSQREGAAEACPPKSIRMIE